MNEELKQMDYNGLILTHLSRLSYVSTSNFIDTVNPSLLDKFSNPPSTGEMALAWGTQFLSVIIPRDLRDEQFKDDWKRICSNSAKSTYNKNFDEIHALIDLLYRKGLLIQNKQLGGFNKKPKNKEDIPVKEEWEE